MGPKLADDIGGWAPESDNRGQAFTKPPMVSSPPRETGTCAGPPCPVDSMSRTRPWNVQQRRGGGGAHGQPIRTAEHRGVGGERDRERRAARTDAAFAPAEQKFRVEMLIGRGGMGEVHLVTDEDLKRQVAMKVMREDVAAGPGAAPVLRRRGAGHEPTGAPRHPACPRHRLDARRPPLLHDETRPGAHARPR